jgi:hypothetical protein
MKLIIDTTSNKVTGTTTDEQHVPPTGYVLVDAPEDFNQDVIDDYIMVDDVVVLNPQILLARAKNEAIKAIRDKFEKIIRTLKTSVAAYEVQTWDTQRTELAVFLSDPTKPTPYTDSLAAARGETREVLFPKIKVKVDGMASLQGTQQRLEKEVEAAIDMAALNAIAYN